MKNPTTLDEAIEAYRIAMHEKINAHNAEDEAKVRKIKAHYELSLARDVLSGIEQDQYYNA